MSTLLQFNDLPCEIQLSAGVKPKYFSRDSKIPQKISSKIGIYYNWSEDGYLYHISTGNFVLSNQGNIGKPKMITINGNLVWEHVDTLQAAQIKQATVSRIKKGLVNYFIAELAKQPKPQIDNFPIKIGFQFTLVSDTIDADNMELFYKKAFLDSIQHKRYVSHGVMEDNPVGFVPDDSRKYVRGFLGTDFELGKSNSLTITIQ